MLSFEGHSSYFLPFQRMYDMHSWTPIHIFSRTFGVCGIVLASDWIGEGVGMSVTGHTVHLHDDEKELMSFKVSCRNSFP